jgi:predicted DNA-binding transcriptional regulator AlpA
MEQGTPATARLYSTREVARAFAVSMQSVWRWNAAGLLPADARTLGGHLRWHADRIDEMTGAPGEPAA